MSSYLVIALFVVGLFVGRLVRAFPFTHKVSERLSMVTVYLLLFLLGISVGSNREIINNLPVLGFKALLLSVGALLGTLVLAWLVVRVFFREQVQGERGKREKGDWK